MTATSTEKSSKKLLRSKVFWIGSISVAILLSAFLIIRSYVMKRVHPKPTIADSATTIIGFNHIGITVKDLDLMLAFYQEATGFELVKRYRVHDDPAADILYGSDDINFETAVLKGAGTFLELTAFDGQIDTAIYKRSPKGPGMTHTCYQSAMGDPGFVKFKAKGADILSRGGEPVELGNYGVSYAYAHDPEGNMLELEQMSENVISLAIGEEWAEKHPLWMTQVAIIGPDIDRLITYYQKVFGIEPARSGTFQDNPNFDLVADLDSLSFKASWFMMDGKGKKLELMQYLAPHATPNTLRKRSATDLGYSFSLEVLDIQVEYERLKAEGVEFLSEPQILVDFIHVFARDIDGNVFSLRQAIDHAFSLKSF